MRSRPHVHCKIPEIGDLRIVKVYDDHEITEALAIVLGVSYFGPDFDDISVGIYDILLPDGSMISEHYFDMMTVEERENKLEVLNEHF